MRIALWMVVVPALGACGPYDFERSREACEEVALGTPARDLPTTDKPVIWSFGEAVRGNPELLACCHTRRTWSEPFPVDCTEEECADPSAQAEPRRLGGDALGACNPRRVPWSSTGNCTLWVRDEQVVATTFGCLD